MKRTVRNRVIKVVVIVTAAAWYTWVLGGDFKHAGFSTVPYLTWALAWDHVRTRWLLLLALPMMAYLSALGGLDFESYGATRSTAGLGVGLTAFGALVLVAFVVFVDCIITREQKRLRWVRRGLRERRRFENSDEDDEPDSA